MIHYEKYDQRVFKLVYVHALVGRFSHYESSVHGQESFEIDKWTREKNRTRLYEHEG